MQVTGGPSQKNVYTLYPPTFRTQALAEIDNIETMRIYKILYPLRVRVELMNIKQWRFSYIFVISF